MNSVSWRKLAGAAVVAAVLLTANKTWSAELTEAQKAWQAVIKAGQPPSVPPYKDGKPPAPEVMAEWRKARETAIVNAADKAKEFYTQFPDDPKAADARKKEYEMLDIALKLGVSGVADRLDALETARLNSGTLSEAERFRLRSKAIDRNAMAHRAEGQAVVLAKMEEGTWQLVKDFPNHPEAYDNLIPVLSNGDGDKAKKLAAEILAGNASDKAKAAARGVLAKTEALGKPLAIQFKSVDGRDFDMTALKGKVVLVDFWATWCGPCVGEVPHVREAYERLHDKGFEIVGISFDQDRSALEKFVAKEKLPWPQYFESSGKGNVYGTQYGIHSIPTMWLVDKAGNLREMNARSGLAEKVEKLLAE